jgi:hypothetical protein
MILSFDLRVRSHSCRTYFQLAPFLWRFFRCLFQANRTTFHIVVFVFVYCFTEMNVLCDEECFSAVCWRFSVTFFSQFVQCLSHLFLLPTMTFTASLNSAATYCSIVALRPRSLAAVPPPARPVRNRLRALGLWALCSLQCARRFGPPHFVRRRGQPAVQKVQLPRNLPASPTVCLHSTDICVDRSITVLGCRNVRSLLHKFDDVVELASICCV